MISNIISYHIVHSKWSPELLAVLPSKKKIHTNNSKRHSQDFSDQSSPLTLQLSFVRACGKGKDLVFRKNIFPSSFSVFLDTGISFIGLIPNCKVKKQIRFCAHYYRQIHHVYLEVLTLLACSFCKQINDKQKIYRL